MLIGLFDSGVGGLTILRDVQRALPAVSTVYFADTKNFPYGTKTEDDVRALALQAVDILRRYQPQAIVVACNTASTSALVALREHIPQLPMIGVVPALKPAVSLTKTGRVAVLATQRTLDSESYQKLKNEFANDITVIDQACPGWVEAVERFRMKDLGTLEDVEKVIAPLVAQQVDTFVLGCTHYPFLRPLIERYAGLTAHILDSGEAVALQVQRVVQNETLSAKPRQEIFLTSGDVDTFSEHASRLLGRNISATSL